MSKLAFQAILVVIGLVAVITGAMGIVSGITDDFYAVGFSQAPGRIVLDSNLRFFSGVWFGLGLVIFWVVPSLEKRKNVFYLISGMIFIGGLGRIASMVHVGVPSAPFMFFTSLELVFPLLIPWRNRLERA